MDRTLYNRLIWTIRDHDRRKKQWETRKTDDIQRELHAIEQSLFHLPEEYREAVYCSIVTGEWPVNTPAHRNTCSMWRTRYLRHVAEALELI